MLAEHGLGDVIVEWSNAKRILGQFRWDLARGVRKLRLSAPLMAINNDDVVLDTIAHEVAHGLAGPRAGHGPRWVAACRVTGAEPSRLAHGTESVPFRWVGVCENCPDARIGRHRLSEGLRRGAIHPPCGGRIRWKDGRTS